MTPRPFLIVAAIILLAGCDRPSAPGASPLAGAANSGTEISHGPVAGAEAALLALRLPDLDGKVQALSQWQGKILVVNYWATWCPPCKEEMPAFSRLQDKFADKGVQFVGISIDSPDKVRKFQAETPVSYPLLLGTMEHMQTAVNLGNAAQGMPFTVLLDRTGKLHSTKLGRLSEAALAERLEQLVR